MLGLVALSSRRRGDGVRAAVVIASGLSASLLLLAATGVTVTLFHLCSLLLIAGLGLDYALFTGHDPRGQQTTTLCAASSVIAFGVMAMGETPVIQGIGMTVATGAAACWAVAMLLSDRPHEDRTDGRATS
jgi:predicted exporter